MTQLTTARLILRRFREADFPAAQEYLGDPEVMRWIEPPFPPEKTKAFLEKYALAADPLVYALVEKESSRLAGHVIFHAYPGIPGCWELGWVLGRAFWGRGYAFEVSEALLAAAQDCPRISRVVLEAHPENRASLRLIRRLGAVPEGEEDGLLRFSISCGFAHEISCKKPLSD